MIFCSPQHPNPNKRPILNISYQVPNAIGEIEKAVVSLFPNPANNFIQISSKSPVNSWTILSSDGLASGLGGDFATRIDITSLKPGLYFFVAKTEAGSSIQRFIVN